MKSIKVRTAAWFGDTQRTFEVPDDFMIDYIAPMDAAAISEAEIRKAITAPIGPTLQHLTNQRKRVVIVVDDLGRPTPASQIIPAVLEELSNAGILTKDIRFLIATGSHRQLNRDDQIKKLGEYVVTTFQVDCHDAFKSPMVKLGRLSNGFPVVVNRIAAEAELLIGIGCVIPHACHGFGGGAKLFCPGIAGMQSIAMMHGFTRKRGRAVLEIPADTWDMRTVSEAFAEFLPPRFLVNVVVNTERQISGIFCGETHSVFKSASAFASQIYRTAIDRANAKKYDVVLVNMYPLDSDPVQSGKSPWIQKFFPNALPIQINTSADGIDYHGWKLLRRLSLYRVLALYIGKGFSLQFMPPTIRRFGSFWPFRWTRDLAAKALIFNAQADYQSFMSQLRTNDNERPGDVQVTVATDPSRQPWIFSEFYPPKQFKNKYKNGTLLKSWPDVVQAISSHFKSPRIAVATAATVQIPEWMDSPNQIED